MKVNSVEIPKLRGDYFTDYRTVRFGDGDGENWTIDCFLIGLDLSVGDNIEFSVLPDKKDEISYHGYLCVSANEDSNGYTMYEFYRAPIVDMNVEVKPYSTLYGRTKERFTVGETYMFDYKKLKAEIR